MEIGATFGAPLGVTWCAAKIEAAIRARYGGPCQRLMKDEVERRAALEREIETREQAECRTDGPGECSGRLILHPLLVKRANTQIDVDAVADYAVETADDEEEAHEPDQQSGEWTMLLHVDRHQ